MTSLYKSTMTPEEEARWVQSAQNGSLRMTLGAEGKAPLFEPGEPLQDNSSRRKASAFPRQSLKADPNAKDLGTSSVRYRDLQAHREYLEQQLAVDAAGDVCVLGACNELATETGRCVRHEAIWIRLHAPAAK